MSNHYIISVLSEDRPGIIADITGAVYELGGDLAELNQSILCGYLTMVLIATFDDDVTASLLLSRLEAIDSPTSYDFIVREIAAPDGCPPAGPPDKTYVMTAQGRNKKGLVHGISSLCYRHNINILDLATTRTDDTYTMILQLDLSKVVAIADVRAALQELAAQSGLQVMLQHHDLFKVTNEIPL
jgi:glycine cleavage system transcriptional repressor